ncbi:MAG: hypothetical protein DWQ37_11060 [Planctomycetota bacterium]|nr:MAG: hypothetical protein DWQ37_11060 [Planctomycetota bacterium]
MESSTVLAFRIFVMLSCLIIVPMAAIFGSAFPDVVKTVLVDRIVAWSTGEPVEDTSEDPEGFREVTPGSTAPRDMGQWQAAPRWGTPAETASWQTPGSGANGADVVALGGAAASPGMNQSTSYTAPVGQPGQPARPLPGGPPESYGAAPLHAADSSPRNLSPASAMAGCDHFSEMERKLREYGATYYLLETWGNNGELYRFHCRMAVGNNPAYTQPFEATHRDAMQAMAQVLQSVEAWRAGRAP